MINNNLNSENAATNTYEHMRGEQISKAVYDGDSRGGGQAKPDVDTESGRVNEFNLFVAVAKHDDITEDIIRKMIITEESW